MSGSKAPREVLQEVLDLVNQLPKREASLTIATMRRVSEALKQAGKLIGVSLRVREHSPESWERWSLRTLEAIRKALDALLAGEPLRYQIRNLTVTKVPTPRPHLIYDYQADERTACVLGILRLVDVVGVDRLRKCPYVDPQGDTPCGRLFVARKRQLACTLEHAQRIQYLRWVEAGRPRGTSFRGRKVRRSGGSKS
jgi:hypothetical protein